MARIVVVGAGFGGLAAAVRLQAAGARVTVIEALPTPGGRAGQFKESGYTFDLGPTIVTAPDLIEAVWLAAGRDLHAEVELIPLRPFYELRFRDGSTFAYGGGVAAADEAIDPMEAEIARLSPDDLAGYRRFMVATARIYERAFAQLGHQPFLSAFDFARILPELVRLGAHRSVYQLVASYFSDERLRIAFSFHPLFIGGNPFRASSIYSIVPYLERRGGVWYARGGTHALVEALARLLVELGGELRCGEAVAEILVERGRTVGVRLAGGERLPAEVVVSNADVATTYRTLLPPSAGGAWTRRLGRFSYSMSCFLLYLGLDRQYPALRHHTILMPGGYRRAVESIFAGQLVEDDLAVYLHAPSRTDSSLAPPGGETLYALVPVPNLAGQLDWPAAGERLRRRTLTLLRERLGLADLERHIVVERRFTPLDFRDRLASHLGSAFSIEPRLLQSAYFRPHNRSARPAGLYLVGAGTHPGAGLPGVLLSAEIAANLIVGQPRTKPVATAAESLAAR